MRNHTHNLTLFNRSCCHIIIYCEDIKIYCEELFDSCMYYKMFLVIFFLKKKERFFGFFFFDLTNLRIFLEQSFFFLFILVFILIIYSFIFLDFVLTDFTTIIKSKLADNKAEHQLNFISLGLVSQLFYKVYVF